MSVKVNDLRGLYVSQLKDAYSAETQLINALPKLLKHAQSEELRTALETHLEETKGHVKRLETIFSTMEYKPGGEKCAAMAGLVKEADELVTEHVQNTHVADAAIVCACQKVEHYEMATYGSLATYARALGLPEDAELLGETLDEEKVADEKLTQIAETVANPDAAMAR